ncbi:MAG: DUF1049 domain-containing protein [Rhodobacteraceae bacterium]|nr:DUF1049 domain-containing protein [Paracoccaceae bacterium]
MRYLKYAFLIALAIVLATLALANRGAVTVRLLTDDLAAMVGFNLSVTLPLFVIICGGIIVGIVVGFIWEWFREMKHRTQAETERTARRKAEREVKRMKASDPKAQDDDVLALIDGSKA